MKFIEHLLNVLILLAIVAIYYIIVFTLIAFMVFAVMWELDFPLWIDILCHVCSIVIVVLTIMSYDSHEEDITNSN